MFVDIIKVFILTLFNLPQTMINKAISDLCKRLNVRVLTCFGHFAQIM